MNFVYFLVTKMFDYSVHFRWKMSSAFYVPDKGLIVEETEMNMVHS